MSREMSLDLVLFCFPGLCPQKHIFAEKLKRYIRFGLCRCIRSTLSGFRYIRFALNPVCAKKWRPFL